MIVMRANIKVKQWADFFMSIEHTAKCPKISCTDISDKMAYANGADPDQTVPAVLSGSTLFAIPQSILKGNNCLESISQEYME